MEHTSEDCQCEGKKCTKCTEVQCIGYYPKDKRLKSGLKSQCRICSNNACRSWRRNNLEYNKERQKIYIEKNAEKVSQRNKEYKHRNRSSIREVERAYWERNKEQKKEKSRRYYDRHKKELIERSRKYRMENADLIKHKARIRRDTYPERFRMRSRQYYLRNIDRIRERYHRNKDRESARWKEYYSKNSRHLNQQAINWRKANPDRWVAIQATRRTRKTSAGGSYTTKEWHALKAQYNNACLSCGKKEPEIKLTADHIIPVFKGGSSYIDNIQPLCKSCNSSKGTKIIDFRPQNT